MMTDGGHAERSPPVSAAAPARVLLVTGMSGAGRSTALKTFEDMGYEAFDNLPPVSYTHLTLPTTERV